jgi:hypothetical protein
MTLEFLNEIFHTCIIPLISIVSVYIVKLVKMKLTEISMNKQNTLEKKYLDMLDVTITNCVLATTQTYVDAMKKENGFNAKAQTTAFNMTKDAVMKLLTEEAQKYLNSAVGDLELYISQKIEAEVKFNKSYNNV